MARQYLGLTNQLCGETFSPLGVFDRRDYFYEKRKGIGSKATNGTVVKPSVVAHITYMVLGAKL